MLKKTIYKTRLIQNMKAKQQVMQRQKQEGEREKE